MNGRWKSFERQWHETQVINCDVCGRLIPRRAWMFDGGAGRVRACSPACQELYFSYLEPTYGPLRGGSR